MTTRTEIGGKVRDGVGESVPRPDGIPKVTGHFAYASDLHAQDMLWGAALRAPYAHARIDHLDVAPALAMAGVHALAPHRLCQLVLPGMRDCPRGDIVMISSTATLHHPGSGAPYNMAKAAMDALALTLSKEERPNGIRVNIVAPGLVETEMGRRLMKAAAGIDDLRELDDVMPFGRVCQPEDVANTVRFLVSADADYLTGERINVHGGAQL